VDGEAKYFSEGRDSGQLDRVVGNTAIRKSEANVTVADILDALMFDAEMRGEEKRRGDRKEERND
jgi:hypothetical protein